MSNIPAGDTADGHERATGAGMNWKYRFPAGQDVLDFVQPDKWFPLPERSVMLAPCPQGP